MYGYQTLHPRQTGKRVHQYYDVVMALADAYAREAASNNEYDNRDRAVGARAALDKAVKTALNL